MYCYLMEWNIEISLETVFICYLQSRKLNILFTNLLENLNALVTRFVLFTFEEFKCSLYKSIGRLNCS